ncbi:hypothetical protein AB8A28_24765 [Tardiphaga sp. 71_E8_N1_1]|uniref:hypothetical protein n=1 Tax=Tardiphaga sp. 71_E8_N1_1 TaxID=3240784 RepID=UPI003F8AA5A5
MAYLSEVVSVPEMLDILVANQRTDADAARELASALGKRAIVIASKVGHVFSDADLIPVIEFVRDFSVRTVISHNAHAQIARKLNDEGVGAWRVQFEATCGLRANAETTQYISAEDACRQILQGMLADGERLTLNRDQVWELIKRKIPELQQKHFDLAWKIVPDSQKKAAGRRSKKSPKIPLR